MYYIFQTSDAFGFKCDEIHEITESDRLISDTIYQQFFDAQCAGKLLRLKNIDGTSFEDIFEEYTIAYEETIADKLIRLNQHLTEIDHMVAECYECSLLGLPLPYDVAALHEERQAIKTEIETLQKE